MVMLKFLGIAILMIGVLAAYYGFNEYCHKKFSYRFFTQASFWTTAIALALLIVGYWWFNESRKSGGDTLNGIVVMCLGGLTAIGLIVLNVKRTNFAFGIGGSILQISTFSVLAYIGFFAAIVVLILSIIASMNVQDVRVVNK